jgi:hypothetical protein
MSYGQRTELSVEGTREILDELKNGSPDTPERRATFEGADAWRERIRRLFDKDREKAPTGG